MQIKKVIKGDEARSKLLEGFKSVADIVSTTAGPGGRNIALQESWGAPKVTKDGVTVAKAVTLSGAEGEGAKMIIQASVTVGTPIKCEGGIIEISFPKEYAFSKKRLEKKENKEVLEEAAASILGEQVRFKFSVEGERREESKAKPEDEDDILKKLGIDVVEE